MNRIPKSYVIIALLILVMGVAGILGHVNSAPVITVEGGEVKKKVIFPGTEKVLYCESVEFFFNGARCIRNGEKKVFNGTFIVEDFKPKRN